MKTANILQEQILNSTPFWNNFFWAIFIRYTGQNVLQLAISYNTIFLCNKCFVVVNLLINYTLSHFVYLESFQEF